MKETEAIVNGVTITLTQDQLNQINQQLTKKSKEDRFLELISDIDISRPMVVFGKYPNKIFWFDSNGNYMFEYDWRNERVWVSYKMIWSVLSNEYGMSYDNIEAFMGIMLGRHLNLKNVPNITPRRFYRFEIEQYLKLKGVTPIAGNRLRS